MEEQARKLFKGEVEKFYIISKSPIYGVKHHYILGTTLQV
jgi:hypothetical protein